MKIDHGSSSGSPSNFKGCVGSNFFCFVILLHFKFSQVSWGPYRSYKWYSSYFRNIRPQCASDLYSNFGSNRSVYSIINQIIFSDSFQHPQNLISKTFNFLKYTEPFCCILKRMYSNWTASWYADDSVNNITVCYIVSTTCKSLLS